MAIRKNVFWDNLAKETEDPEYLRQILLESIRISTIDSVVNQLEEARIAGGLSKADVARKLGSEPANVRRFFGSGTNNPTLSTLAEVAAALGMRVVLEPLPDTERQQVTQALSRNADQTLVVVAKAGPAKQSQKHSTRPITV